MTSRLFSSSRPYSFANTARSCGGSCCCNSSSSSSNKNSCHVQVLGTGVGLVEEPMTAWFVSAATAATARTTTTTTTTTRSSTSSSTRTKRRQQFVADWILSAVAAEKRQQSISKSPQRQLRLEPSFLRHFVGIHGGGGTAATTRGSETPFFPKLRHTDALYQRRCFSSSDMPTTTTITTITQLNSNKNSKIPRRKRRTSLAKVHRKTQQGTTKDRIRRVSQENVVVLKSTWGQLSDALSGAKNRMSWVQTQIYRFWNPDYNPHHPLSGPSTNAAASTSSTRPVKPGLIMDTRWWIWNIALALFPAVAIGLYCEFRGKYVVHQYHVEDKRVQMKRTLGEDFVQEHADEIIASIPKPEHPWERLTKVIFLELPAFWEHFWTTNPSTGPAETTEEKNEDKKRSGTITSSSSSSSERPHMKTNKPEELQRPLSSSGTTVANPLPSTNDPVLQALMARIQELEAKVEGKVPPPVAPASSAAAPPQPITVLDSKGQQEQQHPPVEKASALGHQQSHSNISQRRDEKLREQFLSMVQSKRKENAVPTNAPDQELDKPKQTLDASITDSETERGGKTLTINDRIPWLFQFFGIADALPKITVTPRRDLPPDMQTDDHHLADSRTTDAATITSDHRAPGQRHLTNASAAAAAAAITSGDEHGHHEPLPRHEGQSNANHEEQQDHPGKTTTEPSSSHPQPPTDEIVNDKKQDKKSRWWWPF